MKCSNCVHFRVIPPTRYYPQETTHVPTHAPSMRCDSFPFIQHFWKAIAGSSFMSCEPWYHCMQYRGREWSVNMCWLSCFESFWDCPEWIASQGCWLRREGGTHQKKKSLYTFLGAIVILWGLKHCQRWMEAGMRKSFWHALTWPRKIKPRLLRNSARYVHTVHTTTAAACLNIQYTETLNHKLKLVRWNLG